MKRSTRAAGLLLSILLAWVCTARAAESGKSFRIVLVPERNVFDQQRKYRNLCDYACASLPIEFRFEVLKGYREVLRAVKEGRAEAAFMGSFVAAYGIDNLDFIPLVRPVWPSGASHYRSYIFKRSGLEVTRDLSTWKGKSFVFAGPHTSAGFFYPLSLLRQNGIEDPEAFFGKVHFAGSHDAAVWMVAHGMADLGAAKNTIFEEYTKRKADIGSQVEVLYKGGKYPDLTLVVGPGVSREVRDTIKQVFLTMDSQKEGQEVLKRFGALRFISGSRQDYQEVRQVVHDSGYDIRSIDLDAELFHQTESDK